METALSTTPLQHLDWWKSCFASSKERDFNDNSPDLLGVHIVSSALPWRRTTLPSRVWRRSCSTQSCRRRLRVHSKLHLHSYPSQKPRLDTRASRKRATRKSRGQIKLRCNSPTQIFFQIPFMIRFFEGLIPRIAWQIPFQGPPCFRTKKSIAEKGALSPYLTWH